MTTRPLLLVALLSPLLWGGACSLAGGSVPASEQAPLAVRVTVAWSAPGGGDSNQDMTLDNGVLYWADNVAGAVGATDAAVGRTLWYNGQIGATKTNTLVTKRGVWIQSEWWSNVPTRLFLLDRTTGVLLATVTMPSDAYHNRIFTWTKTDSSLVWHAAGVGLVSLDESAVDPALSTQALTPVPLWPGLYGHFSVPLWYNQKLYFQLRKADDYILPKSDGDDIIVFDPATRTTLKRLVTDYAGGTDSSAPLVYQNRIFYQDWNAVRAIDPLTNDLAFSLPQNVDKGSGKGFAFYQDKLYFSNAMGGGSDPAFDKNLICRSTLDGHLVWHVAADNYSMGTRPVVKDGVLYIITQNGFKLFNANTGALLGVDTSLKASLNDIFDNTIDDGIYLYPRAQGHIWAVKMDWRLDAQGGLIRVP